MEGAAPIVSGRREESAGAEDVQTAAAGQAASLAPCGYRFGFPFSPPRFRVSPAATRAETGPWSRPKQNTLNHSKNPCPNRNPNSRRPTWKPWFPASPPPSQTPPLKAARADRSATTTPPHRSRARLNSVASTHLAPPSATAPQPAGADIGKAGQPLDLTHQQARLGEDARGYKHNAFAIDAEEHRHRQCCSHVNPPPRRRRSGALQATETNGFCSDRREIYLPAPESWAAQRSRMAASSNAKFTGLVRWRSKPAAWELARSASIP